MKEVQNIDLDELRPTGNEHDINDLTDEDIKDMERDSLSEENYIFKDKTKSLFSPQIEVFEPFAAHVDASRTNMSAKQILQSATSDNNELPYILNKNYRAMTDVDSLFVGYAEDDGIVIHSNESIIVVYYTKLKRLVDFYIPNNRKLVNNALTIKYKIGQSDKKNTFLKGDMIFDYTGQHVDSHVPRIGYRTNIMYGSFYGYTAEDAFVASESYAKRATIDHVKKVFVPITKELLFLKNDNGNYFYSEGEITAEQFAKYSKMDTSEAILSELNNVSNKASKLFGKDVDSIKDGKVSKIKVHKINKKKTFAEINDDYIYTKNLIIEIQEMFRKQIELKKSLYFDIVKVLDQDKSASITNNIFSQWESNEELSKVMINDIAEDYGVIAENIDIILEVEISKTLPTRIGDKFANMYAGKGTCSLILPDDIMPKDEYGNTVDIIFNPLGLFGRNNWGTIFEIGLSKIIEDVQSWTYGDDPKNTIDRLEFVNENFIKDFDLEYYDKITILLKSLNEPENWNIFKKDILKNGLYLFVGNFPNIPFHRFANKFLLGYQEKFNFNITKKVDTVYSKELMQFLRDRGYVSNVFDDSVVEEVQQQVYFGKNYWIKLFHTAESKYNAIAYASNHSKSTGEPPRGRAKNGGCHLSWQSSSALEGHKENNAMLKELNTIKSVANSEKNNFNRKMLIDGKYIMKDKYPSPVMNTLNNSLHMIGLKFEHIKYRRGTEFFENDDDVIIVDEIDVSVELEEGLVGEYKRVENTHVCQDENVNNVEDFELNYDPVTGEIIE